jgi:hypothetical protein
VIADRVVRAVIVKLQNVVCSGLGTLIVDGSSAISGVNPAATTHLYRHYAVRQLNAEKLNER